MSTWLVIDNGGSDIKYQVVELGQPVPTPAAAPAAAAAAAPVPAPDTAPSPAGANLNAADGVMRMPNATARRRREMGVLVGPDLASAELTHHAELLYTRPLERGYPTNVDSQSEVWERLFQAVGGAHAVAGVVLTLPPFTPREVEASLQSLLTSHFGVAKVVVAHAPVLAALPRAATSRFAVVVDSGFSFTHVVPVLDGLPLLPAVRRLDVGGKLLTNYLKELVSYGQTNVMDDTFVVDEMKKAVCSVSLHIDEDLRDMALLQRQASLRRSERLPPAERRALEARFVKRYVLPDYDTVKRGYLLPADVQADAVQHLKHHVVTLGGEVLLVPELLFSPSDLGIPQAGLAQVVQDVVELCPVELRPLLRRNVLLAGGNTLFPNFAERLQKELGEAYIVERAEHPIEAACIGARYLAPPTPSAGPEAPDPRTAAASPAGPVTPAVAAGAPAS